MNSNISCWRFVSFRSTTWHRPLAAEFSMERTCVRTKYPGGRTTSRPKADRGPVPIIGDRTRACGGIGRRARLRALWGVSPVGVRVSLGALNPLQNRLFVVLLAA